MKTLHLFGLNPSARVSSLCPSLNSMTTSLKVLTATTGTRTDCWNTPASVVQDVVRFFPKLGLDPCCNNKHIPNVPASVLFDEQDDGLSQEWDYQTVFMNHPYSQSRLWIPYAIEQYKKYELELLLLIKLDVSTKWWQHVAQYPWLAYNKRLRFGDGKSAAPFQSAMIYLGSDINRFVDVFSKDGTIYHSI